MPSLTVVPLAAFFALVSVSHGEEEIVAKSASRRFHVTQEYHGGSLKIVLRGSSVTENEDGIECRISYNLKTHRAVIRKVSK